MANRSIASAMVLSFLFALPVVSAERSGTLALVLPEGDAQAGRATFVALSCASCHRVAGESGLTEPVSANPGPTLGRYHSRLATEELGMSIFAPSHEISATVRSDRGDDLSPMGDFSEAMTVRQFVDLIAYIRSLESAE